MFEVDFGSKQECSARKYLCVVHEMGYDDVSLDMHHLLCWVMPQLVDVLEA